jgi:ADP-heptose:LPS heptosyltransferase
MKRQVSGFLARLRRRPPLSAAAVRALKPQRVLIVRQHNQMGDMVCATPAFAAIAALYPDAELGLVCAPVNREVVAGHPDLDRLFLFDKRACTRPGPLLRFVRDLRGFRPDIAFVLNSVSFSVTSAWLADVSGAPVIVGCDSAPFGYDISRHAYSLEMPAGPELTGHAVDHNLAPLEAVGIPIPDRATRVVPTAEEFVRAREIRDAVPGDGPLWLIHPGAGKVQNLWPAERFAEIALRALRDGRRVLTLQGPADAAPVAAYTAALERLLPHGERERIPVIPPVPVGVCAALLAEAGRFLCNDTGLMHVAGAVGAPTLALFGPTDPDEWGPRTPGLRCLRDASGRLEALDVDRVWSIWRNPGDSPA